jgi:hypothetical protein
MNVEPPASDDALLGQRIIVWMLPSGIPLLLITCLNQPYLRSYVPAFPIVEVAAMIFVVGLGYYEGRLLAHQRRIPADRAKRSVMRSMILYIVLQILIVPVVWFLIAWGVLQSM